mmetsp:Transcript_28888/g.60494  ORF Transcript_28888/g.60494 Transcript_28888/m.60494 type:complete len:98 (+) Transcript_28888:159-452(+)
MIASSHPRFKLVAGDSIPSTTFLFQPSCSGKLVKELKQPGVVSDLSKQLHSGFVSEKSHIPWPAQLAGHIKLGQMRAIFGHSNVTSVPGIKCVCPSK